MRDAYVAVYVRHQDMTITSHCLQRATHDCVRFRHVEQSPTFDWCPCRVRYKRWNPVTNHRVAVILKSGHFHSVHNVSVHAAVWAPGFRHGVICERVVFISVIAAGLNDSQKGRFSVGLNRSAMGWSVKRFERPKGPGTALQTTITLMSIIKVVIHKMLANCTMRCPLVNKHNKMILQHCRLFGLPSSIHNISPSILWFLVLW